MPSSVPDILAKIVEYKRSELDSAVVSRETLEQLAHETRPRRRDFRAALKRPTPAVIAEFKKASPSKGAIAKEADPVQIARAYQAGGAAALSVLTDEKFFGGSFDDLAAARGATRLPVLRKDFTVEEY